MVARARGQVRRLRTALADPESRMARSARSLAWSGANRGVGMVTRLGSNLITTALLMPEAFGLMAVIFALHSGLEMLSDTGIRLSVIRHEAGETVPFLRTAFTIGVLRASVLSAVLVTGGIAIGEAQGSLDFGDTIWAHPDLGWMLAISALAVMARGFISPNLFVRVRQIRIDVENQIQLAAMLIGTAATIVTAWLVREPWALLVGAILNPAIISALSWRLQGPRMAFALDRSARREIWGFGRWMIVSSIASFIAGQGDRLILSAMMDARTLSIYAIARIWIEAFIRLLGMVTPVMQSLMSDARRRSEGEFRRVFRLVSTGVAGLGVVTCVVVALGAAPFIGTFYEAAYHPAGPMVAAMAGVFGWWRMMVLGVTAVSLGEGRRLALSSIARAAFLLAGLPLAYDAFGLGGVLAVFVLTPVPGCLVLLGPIRRALDLLLLGEAAYL
ncbi:MAG: oligosaccharide flippase family protein, partial [Pseudomonadota bacterium]